MIQRRYYMLDEHDYNMIQEQLTRAIHYCEQAEPFRMEEQDQEYTYPGATGYSQSAMQDVHYRLSRLPKTVEMF